MSAEQSVATVNEPSSRRGFLRTALTAGVTAGLWSGASTGTTADRRAYQQTPVATNADWPMFQHDAYNSGTLSTTGPSEPVEAVWTFETGDGLVAQPIIKDGTVFQASRDSSVYAISADTGEQEWSVGTNKPLVRTPAVANSIVYVPTQTGRILAFSVGTGSGQWQRSLGFEVATDLTMTENGVLVAEAGLSADFVYNLDGATGEVRWQYEMEDRYAYDCPVVGGGRIYVGRNATIEARTRSDRTKLWTASVGGFDNFRAADRNNGVTYSDYEGGTLFAGGTNNGVISLDAESGEENWRFENIGDVDSTPVLADGTLYVTTEEPALHAIDPSIGTERWQVDLDGSPTSPVVADDMVYLGTDANSVYGFDAQSSEQRWRFETGGGVVVPPAVLDGTVYAASTDGTLYALREEGAISPGDVTGDGAPAQDLDEDGLYEDVNGDGAFTIVDVQALFANLDSDVVQQNVSKFDFNGDGEVDVTDVQALYARLQSGQ